jgi:Rps23 Pro-64 3,4-dihydroxylase Tpa1-like proline 4-hydroxylase
MHNTAYNLGKTLNYNYLNSKPFPNIVLDDFINPEIANQCFVELKNYDGWGFESPSNEYMKSHQVNKFYSPWSLENLEYLQQSAPTVYNTLQYFNSEPFLKFLSELTGIENLIADPSFSGGGCHKINTGGKLSLHVDYNLNDKNQFRVLNLLLYLNPDWKEEWEGALELWDNQSKKCAHKILPLFNRAAIFTLSDNSIHGHPVPLNCPEDIQRYSLALYYFIEKPNQEYYERRAVVWHDF